MSTSLSFISDYSCLDQKAVLGRLCACVCWCDGERGVYIICKWTEIYLMLDYYKPSYIRIYIA
jgi:hypothetical protein